MLQIDIDQAERIATLTLDRPDKRNALSLELMERLTCALEDIGRRGDVTVVVLGASGSVFSSGHDLGELVDRSAREYQLIFDQCVELMTTIQDRPQRPLAAESAGQGGRRGRGHLHQADGRRRRAPPRIHPGQRAVRRQPGRLRNRAEAERLAGQ